MARLVNGLKVVQTLAKGLVEYVQAKRQTTDAGQLERLKAEYGNRKVTDPDTGKEVFAWQYAAQVPYLAFQCSTTRDVRQLETIFETVLALLVKCPDASRGNAVFEVSQAFSGALRDCGWKVGHADWLKENGGRTRTASQTATPTNDALAGVDADEAMRKLREETAALLGKPASQPASKGKGKGKGKPASKRQRTRKAKPASQPASAEGEASAA